MEKLSHGPSLHLHDHEPAMRTMLDLGMRGRARNKSRSGLGVPVPPAALLQPEPGRISNKICPDLQFPPSLPPLPGLKAALAAAGMEQQLCCCHFTVWHKVKDNRVYKKLCSLFFKIRWKQTRQMKTKGQEPPENNEEISVSFLISVSHSYPKSEVVSFAHKNICRFAFIPQPSTPSGNSLGQCMEMRSSVLLNIPASRAPTGELPACLIANGESVGQMIPLFPNAQMRVSLGNFFGL